MTLHMAEKEEKEICQNLILKTCIKPNIYLLMNDGMLIYCYVSGPAVLRYIYWCKGTELTPK